MEQKFYRCAICGNIVGIVNDGGGQLVCCGQPMTEIVPNTTEAAVEKHIPVITVDGQTVTVKVGETAHPMTEQHYIQWISLSTASGNQRKVLKPNDQPQAVFEITDGDAVVNAYAYCNLHGLWKK